MRLSVRTGWPTWSSSRRTIRLRPSWITSSTIERPEAPPWPLLPTLPDDTAIDLGGDRLAADDMNFVEAFRTAAGDANAGLTRLVELMSSERWQPGSEIVDEIVTRAGRDIKGVLANVGPFMRLVDHDLEDMWPADENDRSRDQDEVNGLFDQILTVASECA